MSIDTPFSRVSFPSLRSEATADVLRARAAGHAAGYAAGLADAENDIAAQEARRDAELADAIAREHERVAHAVAVLTAAADALNRRTVPVLQEAQDAIAATAIELAEVIVGTELSTHEKSAASALHRALATADTALVLQVRLNPGDLTALDPAVLEDSGVTFMGDPTLAPGDAVTEFADGYLDARVGAALERARSAILEVEP
jgi:flagellar assembly protein FliH